MVTKPSNIINLESRSKSRAGDINTAAAEKPIALSMPQLPHLQGLPQYVSDSCEFYTEALFKLLSQFFNDADDLLFEQASNNANSLAQSSFFEAMRSLRLERGAITQQLLLDAHKSFKDLPQVVSLSESPSNIYEQELFLDDVTLVQDEVLEEEVAVNAMVSRCLATEQEVLEQLLRRFCCLLQRPAEELQLQHLALHPEALCKQLAQQLTGLSLTIKAKLMLLKLFEKTVLKVMPELARAINQRLEKLGVLPGLSQQLRLEKRQQRQLKAGSGATAQALARVQQLLNSSELLAADAATLPAGSQQPLLEQADLSLLLNQVQQQGIGQTQLQGQGLLAYLQPTFGQHGQISQLNQKMINLVNMLFEYIWDDPDLAEPMRSLLSRMQIPLLKVALVDEAFFGTGSHPARQLLNEMARAALSWEEPDKFRGKKQQDPLYELLHEIVQRVLNEFDQDVSLFTLLLQQLRDFTHKEQRRAKLIAQRTVDTAKGEAKSEQARQQAHQSLDGLLAKHPCPASLMDLMHQAWARCLHMALLKHGQASLVWQQQLQLAESVCATVSSLCELEGAKPKALLQRLGQLLGAMRKQLTDVGYDEYQLKPLFNRLAADCKRAAPKPVAQPSKQSVRKQVGDDLEGALGQTKATQPATTQIQPPVIKAPAVGRRAAADDFVKQAKALKQGAWLEFSESGSKRRCRLAAIVNSIGRYIFVDRRGKKLLELDLHSLAQDLERGALRVLDEGMLFDRALEAVIGDLRQSRKSREQRLDPRR